MSFNNRTSSVNRMETLCRIFLGVVFLYASFDKILHPAEFARAVYNYQILPDVLINLTALILPWLELLIGICLLSGVWLPGAVLWSNTLLWGFFLALLYNQYRGLDVHCGCFSTQPASGEQAPTTWYVFRDSFFLWAGGYLMLRSFTRPDQSSVLPD